MRYGCVAEGFGPWGSGVRQGSRANPNFVRKLVRSPGSPRSFFRISCGQFLTYPTSPCDHEKAFSSLEKTSRALVICYVSKYCIDTYGKYPGHVTVHRKLRF